MVTNGNVFRAATLTIGAMILLAGCASGDDSSGGAANTSGPSLAADVPRTYDPCKDIPESVLASEKLQSKDLANLDADSEFGRIKWMGCAWVRSNGYAASIRTTNLTVDVVRGRNFPDAHEFTVGGRRAISTRQFDGPHIMEACTLDVEMKGGGSLEFGVNNPPSRSETGSTDTCQLARTLAEKVVPSMPPTA
ncbi:DUF3558 domain-containing protein [Nocardia sp. 2YAB30]|uniref:DUF3558 domain-containing protein n=1 Tax=Nocardia sp. 2YAB30 TaxID=3233022 RepID=UPI003F9D2E92